MILHKIVKAEEDLRKIEESLRIAREKAKTLPNWKHFVKALEQDLEATKRYINDLKR